MLTVIFVLLIAQMVATLGVVIVAFTWSERVDEELDMQYEALKQCSERIDKVEKVARRKMKLQLNSVYGKMLNESEDNDNGKSED